MERYEFSEREKQLFRALSEEKTAAELMQAFSREELRAYLPQMQKRDLVSCTFTISGLLFAKLTDTGSVYLKENPRLRNPVNYQWVMAMIALLSLIVAFLAWVTRCGD